MAGTRVIEMHTFDSVGRVMFCFRTIEQAGSHKAINFSAARQFGK